MTTATAERRNSLIRRVNKLPDSEIELVIKFLDDAKARRNAEYLAMLDESFRQHENGEVVTMTFTEWEEWLDNGCPELHK
ncbi:hypothetical protein FACS1894216_20200 [Synergistales bacterium]|nr:hypothetical protein FACS1894216_20200 [Synergistales bacterium]